MGLFNRSSSKQTTSLVVTPVWGLGWANADVVGESHYTAEIQGLLPRGLDDAGQELTVDVLLCREPDNRYDRNAIAIRAVTGTIGYLPKDEAARYAPVLDALASNGRVAETSARIWGSMGTDWESNRPAFFGSVRIVLPEPHMLFPVNLPPSSPHAMLPFGSAIQVTGEENYRASLAPWLNVHGEAWVHGTLHSVTEATARTSKTLAEVRIDGLPAGRLTPKMSQDMLPAVEFLASRGHVTGVRAIVKGNALKSDVVLYTARAGELPADWLAKVARTAGSIAAGQAPAAAKPDGSPPSNSMTTESAPPPPSTLPPANWYPDPNGVKRLRYWDGAQWTDHTAD